MAHQGFSHAMKQTQRQEKARIDWRNGHGYMVDTLTGKVAVYEFVFYKTDDLFSDDSVYIKTETFKNNAIPKMEIPLPVRRNVLRLDGKFFYIGPKNRIQLFMPYHYFYFLTNPVVNERGFRKLYGVEYISRLDSNIVFEDWSKPKEVVDETMRESVKTLFKRKMDLEQECKRLEEEIRTLDPDDVVRREYEQIVRKLEQSAVLTKF